MNIDKFKHQHVDILGCVAALRNACKAGIQENAEEITRLIIAMSSTVKLHLAVEDQLLYPALCSGNNAVLDRMGKKFQDEMEAIASAYVHARMQKENTVFYPAIEAL